MRGKRRQYEAELKARVALAALKSDKTINEVATLFEVHPNMVTKWKQRAQAELPRIFSEHPTQGAAEAAANEQRLYEQIGRLKVELDWLKKKLSVGT
jgi:transposase-like protein